MSAPEPRAVSAACERCGGARVDVRVAGTTELVAAKFNRKDRTMNNLGVGLTGVACTSCGYVELYATDPGRLA